MVANSGDSAVASSDSSESSLELHSSLADIAFRFARPISMVMAERSRDNQGVERSHMIEAAPDDLRWIHPDVKLVTVSRYWSDPDVIREIERIHITEERVKGIRFRPAEDDERPCSYDTSSFVMFYGDIVVHLHICPPFSPFQRDILRALNICPSQLTWNAWVFVLCYEVICARLRVDPSVSSFFFFFTYSQQKNGGWIHFVQLPDRVVIENMISSIRSWKNSFFKVCSIRGFQPFFLRGGEFTYPVKWSVPTKQNRKRSFEELSVEDQDVIVQILATGPFDAQYVISSWLKHEKIKIQKWKMDRARMEAARARVLAKQKPLAPPPATLEEPQRETAPAERSSEVTSARPSGSRSKAPARTKTLVSRKRKAPSSDSSGERGGTSAGEPVVGRRVKTVSWPEMEPVDLPVGQDCSFDNIDSLWYRGLDYGSYLRHQLLKPHDIDRCADYMNEHGPLRLVKSSAVQMIRSGTALLSAIPLISQTVREHAETDPGAIERLQKELEEKNYEVARSAAEMERLNEKVSQLEDRSKVANELLMRREEELESERKDKEKVRSEAAEVEAKLRQGVLEAEEAAYVMYQNGFDQAVTQIKHFNQGMPIDCSKINRDKDLEALVAEFGDLLGPTFDLDP